MMIDRLEIINFKNYPDVNVFDWSISQGKNVILIGGMNGSGKTTVSEAIRLCLYGNKIEGTPLSESNYTKYLLEMWSKGRTDEPMSITMDISIDSEDPVLKMTVTRSFKYFRNKIHEKLSLTKNGKDVELIDQNYWEFYIGKILPAHLSRYFFFDGEHIRDVISSDESSNYLYNAIRDLTGVKKLEILKNDLLEVKKRISRVNIGPGVKKKIRSLEGRIAEINREIEDARNQLNDFNSEMQALVDAKSNMDEELNRAIGAKEESISILKKKIESEKQRLSEIGDYIQDFVYSSYPRLICNSLTKEMLSAAKKENDNNMASLNGEYMLNKLSEIKEAVSNIHLSKKDLDSVLTIIDSEFEDLSTNKHTFTSPIIDLTYNQIESIKTEKVSEEETFIFVNRLRERENLLIEISKLEKQLSQFSDESVNEFENKLKEIKEQIAFKEEQIRECRTSIKLKNDEIEKINKQIYQEEKSLALTDRDSFALKNINEVIKNIDIRISIQMTDSVANLEIDINKIYNILKNKKDMVKHISVMPDYSLKLSGFDNSIVSTKYISEGEKGILMYSVMYGLLNISSSKLPLIIDSPLGRMDSAHVNNLISKLYPVFGNQVIILSHDREITPDVLPKLKSVLSKTYLLSNDYPKITEGYFR